jgi:SAM-dependent methyltransferase
MADVDEWDARYRATDLLWGAGPNARFAAAVADLPAGRALDLACGEGRNAIWLAARGWEVTAVDFSGVALERARELAARHRVRLDLQQRDVRHWTPPARAFELVAVLYLQLPSAELAIVHRRAADAVTPGGTMVVLGHDQRNLDHGHGGPQDPDRLLDPDTVAGELTGLRILTAETVTRQVVTTPPAAALDTYVRAVRPAEPG